MLNLTEEKMYNLQISKRTAENRDSSMFGLREKIHEFLPDLQIVFGYFLGNCTKAGDLLILTFVLTSLACLANVIVSLPQMCR